MGKLGLSWKKAAIVSAIVHLIILCIAVIFFVVVPSMQEQETYEIDLTQSVLDDGGSGQDGGGGGNRSDLFPKPLTADEVATRTKAVMANVDPSPITDIPDAVEVPNIGSHMKDSGNNSHGLNDGSGGGGSGSGHGAGNGSGTGDGSGSGSGAGHGIGTGTGHGTAHAAFDTQGFYATVDANKVFPPAYIRRPREIDAYVHVYVRIDTNGNGIEQSIQSGDDPLLNEEAMAAVSRSLPYPNPTGDIQPVVVPVHFLLHEQSEDEE